jgi:hypothetical protein
MNQKGRSTRAERLAWPSGAAQYHHARVADHDALARAAGRQFFMDSHEIPLRGAEKLQDPLPAGFGLLGTV